MVHDNKEGLKIKIAPKIRLTWPFVDPGISIEIPLDVLRRSLWGRLVRGNPILGENIIKWCISRILRDRFEEEPVRGAWGHSYSDFMKFVYQIDQLPSDLSHMDSITYTSIIVQAIKRYIMDFPDSREGQLNCAIQDAVKYLLTRQDKTSGGFGKASFTSRKDVRIAVDLRHSAYAIEALSSVGTDPAAQIMGIKYIGRVLSDFAPQKERAVTLSALHHLFSSKSLSSTIRQTVPDSLAWNNRFETELINKFDPETASWDMDKDPVDKARVDDALFVLSNLCLENVNSDPLREICKSAVSSIIAKDLVPINADEAGVQFINNGVPDIGTTLQFLEIIISNRNFYRIKPQIVRKLIRFIINEYAKDKYTPFSYGWQIVSALHFATTMRKKCN